MAVWRDISGPVWRVIGRVDSGSILGSILDVSGPYSRKPHQYTRFKVHTAVGRASRLNMTKYGVLEVPG